MATAHYAYWPSGSSHETWSGGAIASVVDATLPTTRPWQIRLHASRVSVGVAGLEIVDVGAGGSDAAAALLARGANAYVVDPCYRSVPGLVRDVQAYLARQAAIGQLSQAREASAAGIAAQRGAFRRCVASFQDRRARGRYLAAVATDSPFDAQSQDFVYSVDCITQYLDRDSDPLQADRAISSRKLGCGLAQTLDRLDREVQGSCGRGARRRPAAHRLLQCRLLNT